MTPERVKISDPALTREPVDPLMTPAKVVSRELFPVVSVFDPKTTEELLLAEVRELMVWPEPLSPLILKMLLAAIVTSVDEERAPLPERARVPALMVVAPV